MANAATIDIARDVRTRLASSALTERQAKLYSQRLRRDMGREGLATFTPGDIDLYLDDALLLIQCGLLERSATPTSTTWRDSIKRAGQILEWLSQSSLKPAGAPLHLLAAAAYQLADYPAMALGHLRQVPDDQPFSPLLREFLRANFPSTLEAIRVFWRDQRALGAAERIEETDLTAVTFQHVVMCLGTICAYLRTGNDAMVNRALAKLDRLAASLLHSRDPYSYMLAALTAASCRRYVETCIWPRVAALREVSSVAAAEALVQFARSAFVNRRTLVWPAQAAGIDRLRANTSFVLCTPTGSGKTTVATLAVVQNLFADTEADPLTDLVTEGANLILYLVPSRALAAEVESRLAQDLKGVAANPVVVTGLYGGNDWGPTDAWIQNDRPTILICTFEKADALLRYLGVLFLGRVQLVVIDEAHMVDQQRRQQPGPEEGLSRSFRLEQLGARLLHAQERVGFRVIALSAVAAQAAPALARWISGNADAQPTTSSYRSTRQMIGRIEVTARGQYTIRYDLMDGRSLRFTDETAADTPYVRDAFPPLPNGINVDEGPEVRMRAPALWAALQLAAERPDGSTPSVLISITQSVEAFAETCADLMDHWPPNVLPNYRTRNENDELWQRCLASAEDYFTNESVEYRLLAHGIAVHHGKMPALLARRLKVAIDRGYVRVIIATSTLSEGVNLPVNVVIIPSLVRATTPLTLQEFTNLVGRAGRPGVATEGSALVILPERTMSRDKYGRRTLTYNRQWDAYTSLIAKVEQTTIAAAEQQAIDEASSPLANLLLAIEQAWTALTGSTDHEDLITWLEQTAVVGTGDEESNAFSYLDSLDAFLIAALQEIEELRDTDVPPDQVEEELTTIWQRTYAFAARREEQRLTEIWLARGRAIATLYPDGAQRRKIYKTSLSPRSAMSLLGIADAVRATLQNGTGYAVWEAEERFTFISNVLEALSQVPSFRISTKLGKKRTFNDWPMILRWWLAKDTLNRQPTPKDIPNWYDFVAQNFIYRGAWGLGSIIGLLMDEGEGDEPIRALEITDWPRSGLPWIAFWLKELLTWGTLEPVAAFLLARGDAINRTQAEADAADYYHTLPEDEEFDPNDALDPRRIRNWVDARRIQNMGQTLAVQGFNIEAILERPPADYVPDELVVSPLPAVGGLSWIDPAGYVVARSSIPEDWPETFSNFEFTLSVENSRITGNAYLRHQ